MEGLKRIRMIFTLFPADTSISYHEGVQFFLKFLTWLMKEASAIAGTTQAKVIGGACITGDREKKLPSLLIVPELLFQGKVLDLLGNPPDEYKDKYTTTIIREEEPVPVQEVKEEKKESKEENDEPIKIVIEDDEAASACAAITDEAADHFVIPETESEIETD